jgi:hypothetical protein
MKDFYSLTAFFQNTPIRVLDDGRDANTPPLLFLPAKQDEKRWPPLDKKIKELRGDLEERKKVARADFERWLASNGALRGAGNGAGGTVFHLPLASAERNEGKSLGRKVTWEGKGTNRSGLFGPAPEISGGIALKGLAPSIPRHGKATLSTYLWVDEKPSGTIFGRMDKSQGYRGWDLHLSDGRPVVHIIDQWPDKALKVTSRETLKPGRWNHVLATFDGATNAAEQIAIYINGKKTNLETNNSALGPEIKTATAFRLGGRTDKDGSIADPIKNGKVFAQDIRIYHRTLKPAEIARMAATPVLRSWQETAAADRTKEITNALMDIYFTGFDKPGAKISADLAELTLQERVIRGRGAMTLVMEEKKDSKPTAHILARGVYSSKGELVSANTPEALNPLPPKAPRDRMGLARWIVSSDNPLTARVTMNRLWAQFFGNGIVETTEDFGVMGARPTHPELLDWLAVEFMENGWDYRAMARLMVTSATYRQSAAVTPEKLEKDPLNKWLSRGPRYRLDAEQIRDLALAASGLLVPKVGGPSVKPYQPEGVWEAVAMKDSNTRFYKEDEGENLYRRSIYTYWKRTAPPASMEILNAPSREVFCTRRERSNTPLQAFVTMNDVQFVEAARHLASRSVSRYRTFDERLDYISQSLIGRRLAADERQVIGRLQKKAAENYLKEPASAEELLQVGKSKVPPKIARHELASWTLVASQIMNLDEALTK